jgi:hypothetical protein
MSKTEVSKNACETLIVYVHSKVITEVHLNIRQGKTDEDVENLVDDIVENTFNICDESYITKIYDEKFEINYERLDVHKSKLLDQYVVRNRVIELGDECYEIQCISNRENQVF